MKIKAVDGDEPHESWGGWENFLAEEDVCKMVDEADGVKHFQNVNCNYILFPSGDLILNYGYHGASLMARIRTEGAGAVLAEAIALETAP